MLSGAELGKAAWEMWGRHGVPIFPCNDKKRPLVMWQSEATTDEQEVIRQFTNFGSRARMVGAKMGNDSGLFALDFDFYKGPEAKEFLTLLMASKCLPKTRIHETKSGGIHYIYATERKMPRNSLPHKNVEVRGEGGYIIVPPSHGYKVQSIGAIDAPDALLQRLERAERAFSALSISGLTEYIMQADSFHEALTALAAKLHARGDDPAKVMETLTSTMQSSVASNPMHERHNRWLEIMRGGDGELARIHRSAFKKFNPKKGQMDVDAIAGPMGKSIRNRDVTLGGFFAAPPKKLGDGAFAVNAPSQKTQNTGDSFPFERSYNAAEVSSQDNKTFLCHPLIMEGDVVVLTAEPKAGKTLTAMTLCLHMASGTRFGELSPLNKAGDAAKIPIVYFALEGQGAIRKRVRAWMEYQRKANGVSLTQDDVRLFVVERPINLTSDEAKQEIVDKLVMTAEYFRKRGWGGIGMVVFDTLTKAMPGKDQNSVEDTSAVFQTVDMMREVDIDCAVMFIHHNNRQSKAPRGSSNIMAEPDTILSVGKLDPIIVDGVQKDCVQLGVYMARAIDDTQVYRMAMEEVDIGLNSQNIAENAPVLSMVEDYSARLSPTDDKLRKNVRKAKDEFYDVVWQALSDAPGMQLRFEDLTRIVKGGSQTVRAYYSSFLNTNSKSGAKTTWQTLMHKDQLPPAMSGMSFTVSDTGVKMLLDTRGMLA